MNNATFIFICPYCGHTLLKAENGAIIEVTCPRCKERFAIRIKENKLDMQRISIPATSDNDE